MIELWKLKREGREPNVHSANPLEKRMAEALAWLKAEKAKRLREGRSVRPHPSLEDIFAENDEFSLLDVKPCARRGGPSQDRGAAVLLEVMAFYERHSRHPDPDAMDHDEMRLGAIWDTVKRAPTDQMRAVDRWGRLAKTPPTTSGLTLAEPTSSIQIVLRKSGVRFARHRDLWMRRVWS